MYTCYVIDDEEHAVEVLVGYIKRFPGLSLIGSNINPVKAVDEIVNSKIKVEIIFLDVDMPEMSGLDVADIIGSNSAIIFTTAFPNYAVQAFDKNTADFLLKPISFERFAKSITKVQNILKLQKTAEPPKENDHFFINPGARGKAIQLNYLDTFYVEGLKNYIVIHTSDEKHITYMSMMEIEKALPTDRFFRIHKSYIINVDKIKSIDGNSVVLTSRVELPIGNSFKETFTNMINTKTLKSGRKGY